MKQRTVTARSRRSICAVGGFAILVAATLGIAQRPATSADKPATKEVLPTAVAPPAPSEKTDTMMPKTPGTDARGAMRDSMMGMMKSMESMKMTGDADRDFVMMMKVHHQGAIDMAQLELKSGTDPKIRAMAKRIIEAQQKEIKEFAQWLRTRK